MKINEILMEETTTKKPHLYLDMYKPISLMLGLNLKKSILTKISVILKKQLLDLLNQDLKKSMNSLET